MTWKATDPMNEKVKFISLYLEGEETVMELCELFGISRKTGYKWIQRYESDGVEALKERSRAPRSHPHATPDDVVTSILRLRRRHPQWGPKKLRVIMLKRYPDMNVPAASTIGEILRKNGMTEPRKRKRRSSPHQEQLRSYDYPNAVWCADFKGHFPVDGKRCYPLTITDGYSRYLLRCQGLRTSRFGPSRKVFEAAFREYGLPEMIRTDNGTPFSSLAPAGLSSLAVWWIRLGIHPERIMPGRPDQNGRHERMHRTLKMATARPPRSSLRAQQKAFDRFQREYNEERPHEGLNMEVPASLYQSSQRTYPEKIPDPEYPADFYVTRAYPNSVISFSGIQWYLSAPLAEQLVGLKHISEDRWMVYFSNIAIGIADLQLAKKRQYRSFGRLVPAEQDPWLWHDGTGKAYMKTHQ